jgi:hypothetical protein
MKEGEEGKSLEKAENCLGKLTEEVKDPKSKRAAIAMTPPTSWRKGVCIHLGGLNV